MRGKNNTAIIGTVTEPFNGRSFEVTVEDKKYITKWDVLVGEKLTENAKLTKKGDLVSVDGPLTEDKRFLVAKGFINLSFADSNKGKH